MGDIFRIIKSSSYYFICDEIKYLSTSKEVIKEMGEPLLVDKNQKWIFAYDKEGQLCGFIAYKKESILYVYVLPEYRGKGIFSILYNELPQNTSWNVLASNMSYPLFLRKGFTIIKNYKTCHKLKLEI